MSVTILQGDCRVLMHHIVPLKSIQTCVTSPPYFGLRDYGMSGQLGLEASVEEYVAILVSVFREVRDCLKDDGTLWLNLGDSYAGSGRGGDTGKSNLAGSTTSQDESKKARGRIGATARAAAVTKRAGESRTGGFKHGDLMGAPWRVALALQADGWYLRQDIIWSKPNPMPESVTSRCTKAHEYIFLLSKSRKYYFDAASIQEPVVAATKRRLAQSSLAEQAGSDRVPGKTNGTMKAVGGSEVRNKRSVWTVTTKPFKEAHFATFPPDLIEPCILAGSASGDTVLDPFGGAGTTGLVAQRHGRNAVLCELNPAYIDIARRRLA